MAGRPRAMEQLEDPKMSTLAIRARRFGASLAAAMLTVAAPSAAQAVAAPSVPAPVACPNGCWKPAVKTSWDVVLMKVPRAPFRAVSMYEVDGFDASAATVAALHAAGKKVVCYVSAGSYEDWRPDASQFPASILGAGNGWAGENWLDIRDVQKPDSKLRAIMKARISMCVTKGFDAIDFDNVDGYTNDTGLPLTDADQLFYNATLANDAHAVNLAVLLKNDLEQIPRLLPYFDGAVNEQCNVYQECTTAQNGSFGLDQFVKANKPVFQIEYTLRTTRFCPADNANNVNGVRLSQNLDDSRFEPCR